MGNFIGIVAAIKNANLERNKGDIDRRSLKLLEEIGELSEAYISVTSTTGHKGLSWDDFREEAVDVLIVATDIALTPLDGADVGSVALLPSCLITAMEKPLTTHDAFQEQLFELAAVVTRARQYANQNNTMSFHGAANRMVQLASNLVYSSVDERSNDDIRDHVVILVETKLNKWVGLKKKYKEYKYP